MPYLDDRSRGVRLHYAEQGPEDAPAVLLLAPGGMASTIEAWKRGWVDPHGYLTEHRLIAMDQRNAGQSRGPIEPDHGWATYLADQIALVEHLGLDDLAVLGMCIGGPYGLALCHALPDRVRAAVLFQPLGKDGNQDALDERFDEWRHGIEGDHPEADAARWAAFREAMFGGRFVFSVTADEVAQIGQPILLFAGDDHFHPRTVSDVLAACLPEATYVKRWKEDALADATQATVRGFLDAHLPAR